MRIMLFVCAASYRYSTTNDDVTSTLYLHTKARRRIARPRRISRNSRRAPGVEKQLLRARRFLCRAWQVELGVGLRVVQQNGTAPAVRTGSGQHLLERRQPRGRRVAITHYTQAERVENDFMKQCPPR